MTDRELEMQLKHALDKCAPDDFGGVLSRCEKRKGTVIPMTGKKKNRWLGSLAAACLALVLLGGAAVQRANAVASVISLDVNPSIELTLNRREKVLSCTALNADAQKVLADMDGGADLKGAKVDVAVNAIVGALLRSGYLESVSSAILISVEDADGERAQKLRRELTGAVDAALQQGAASASVLSQTVDADKALERLAQEKNISTGKAALISRLTARSASLDFDALAALTVEELKDLVESGAAKLPIGIGAAAEAAEKYAGTLAISSVTAEVDPELDEQPAHYEVELHTLWGEYEYTVDAFTGEILSGKANIVDDAPKPADPGVQERDIGLASAKEAALHRAGLTAATFLKAERDDDEPEYDFDFTDGVWAYECTIAAADGSVLDFERELLDRDDGRDDDRDDDHDDDRDDDHDDDDDRVLSAGDIGAAAAMQAALHHAGFRADEVSGLEVERDDDEPVYEVEFTCGVWEYEYKIDAATGAVLEHERDD